MGLGKVGFCEKVSHCERSGVIRKLTRRSMLPCCALSWARAQGLRVNPVCSYVAVYIRRHAEWQDLLPTTP